MADSSSTSTENMSNCDPLFVAVECGDNEIYWAVTVQYDKQCTG
jgi:hypothetical protein